MQDNMRKWTRYNPSHTHINILTISIVMIMVDSVIEILYIYIWVSDKSIVIYIYKSMHDAQTSAIRVIIIKTRIMNLHLAHTGSHVLMANGHN